MVSPVFPPPTSISPKSAQQGSTTSTESTEAAVEPVATESNAQLTFNPVNSTFGATNSQRIRDLIPNLGKTGGINQLAEAIGDGTATLLIPLLPKENHLLDISGSKLLKFFGIKAKIGFEVKPQTVARLEVEVKDGRIVAAQDSDGNYKGFGSRLTLNKPLVFPLESYAEGVSLRDGEKKPSQKDAEAEVIAHALIHPTIKNLANTRLADVMKDTMANHETKERPTLPSGLIDWKNIKIEKVVNVTLKDGVVPLGNASVRLAKGNKLTVKGDYNHATLESEGPLKIESAVINDGISEVKLGKTTMKLRADYQQTPAGFEVKGTLSEIDVVESARLTHPRSANDPQPDFLELNQMKLKSGQITTIFGPGAARGSESRVNISADVEGEFGAAQLTMKNKKGEAMVHVNRPAQAPAVRFTGALKTTPKGLDFKGDLKGTEISIDNLQTDNGVAGMSLKKGTFQGNVQLAVPAGGEFAFKMQASQVDVQLGDSTPITTAMRSPNALLAPAGYAGQDDTTDVKLHSIKLQYGQTEKEKKSGRTIDIAIGGDVGMSVDGDLRAMVDVRKLKVRDFQLGATQLEGTISHFRAADDARGFEFKSNAKIKNSQIDRIQVNTNGIGITGKGALQGEMDLEIKADYVHVGLKEGSSASLEVEKGARLGGLRLGSPTTSNFIFGATTYNSRGKGEAGSVKLRKGSFIDAKLEGGTLPIGDDTHVEVQGGTVRFDLKDFVTQPGKKPTLDGSLKLHAKVKTDELKRLPILQSSMVQVTSDDRLTSELAIDASVKMLEDGSFKFVNALTSVDARVGNENVEPRRILGFHPQGVKPPEEIQSKTAAEIAGDQAPQNAFFLGQQQIAALMSDLKLTVKVPIEGKLTLEDVVDSPMPLVGKIGLHFDPGTQLTVNLTAKDGKLVTSESGVTLSKPGRTGGYFVQIQRAYFDAKNNLCIEVKIGEHTFCFSPGPFKKIPTDIGPLTEWANTLARKAPKGGDDGVLKVKEAEVRLEGLKFKPGTIRVPGATIEIGPKTHLFLDGKPFANGSRPPSAMIYGDIDIKRLDVAQDTFAMKGGEGRGRVRVSWMNGVASTTLEGLDFRADYSVGKRENGDYAAIKDVVVKDGKAELTMPLDTDTWTLGEPDVVYFELPRPITGHIDGARFTDDEDPKKKGPTAEVGSTEIKGSTIRMSAAKGIEELKLELGAHDWAVQNLKPESPDVTLNARAVGDSVRVWVRKNDWTFDATRGNLHLDVNGPFKQGGVDLTATSTQVEASGNLSLSSKKGLNLVDGQGRIRIDSVVTGTITPKSKALGKGKKDKGSAS